jgi:hypothetical protein
MEALVAPTEWYEWSENEGNTWRLPTITELASLLDMGRCDPALPADHPFREIGQGYWSSTTSCYDPRWAMVLHLDRGAVGVGIKRDPRYLVWPVAADVAGRKSRRESDIRRRQ